MPAVKLLKERYIHFYITCMGIVPVCEPGYQMYRVIMEAGRGH